MAIVAAQLMASVEVKGAEEAEKKLEQVGKKVEQTQEKIDQADRQQHGLLGNLFGGISGMLGNATSFLSSVAANVTGNLATTGLMQLQQQLTSIIPLTQQHDAMMAQTAAVIKSTGDASGMTAKQIGDMASSLSKMTPFAADTIQDGENLLLTFTTIGKQTFPGATQAILDISQAMNQDLKSSAIQVGKALDDPTKGITALTRVGVTFDAQQKALIKTYQSHGEMAKAQAIILKELEREFGGSAEAAGKTFGGQVKVLNNHLDELKVKIGTAVLPMLSGFLGTINTVVLPALEKFGDWFVKTAVPAMKPFVSLLEKDAVSVLTKFGEWFTQKGLPILKQFGDWFLKDGLPALQHLADSINTNLLPPLESLISNASQLALNLADWLYQSGLLQFAVDTLIPALGTVVQWVSDLVGWFNQGSPAALAVRDALLGIGTAIALMKLGDFVTNQVKGFIDMAGKARDAAMEWGGKLKDVGSKVLDLAGSVKDKLVAAFQGLVDKVTGKGGATDQVKQGLDDVKTKEEEVGDTAKGDMATKVQEGSAEAETSLGGIKTSADEAATAEENIGTTAKDTMAQDVATGAGEAETAIQGIATTADETTAKIESDSATMEGSLGGVLSKIGMIGMALNGINFGESQANSAANQTLSDPKLQAEGAAEWKKVFGNAPMPGKMSADQLSMLYAAWQRDHPNEPFPFMHFASGTSFAPGGWAIVGEDGPEAMYVPQGAQITSNNQLGNLFGSSSGTGQTLIFQVDGNQFARVVLPYMVSAIRSNVGVYGI